ncbi:uncharacterized protein L3040_008125 [Drepanopeziza brunnea f. sp. 'multigermtubi']|uniref:uncharacterized protein n=1 Tax=Drepanopeziza brunnea f. sp. 'multigermtubi' TaxID=698441 RepID=UPI00239705D7|nr:hypothetical protein L3040_008125 [Drepanopeziza brunnea f. sp. 'multigermtubi']
MAAPQRRSKIGRYKLVRRKRLGTARVIWALTHNTSAPRLAPKPRLAVRHGVRFPKVYTHVVAIPATQGNRPVTGPVTMAKKIHGLKMMCKVDKLVAGLSTASRDPEVELKEAIQLAFEIQPPSSVQEIVKTRLQWLLSRLPRLQIPHDPITTHPVLRNFHLFNMLPIEIRIKIWGLISMEPRHEIKHPLLPFCLFTDLVSDLPYPVSAWNSNVEGQSRHPVLLQVCRESRAEGRRYYTSCSDKSRRWAAGSASGAVRNTYHINFATDVFEHGSSRFAVDEWVPSSCNFNFPRWVIGRIQHVRQLPCYQAGFAETRDIRRHTFLAVLRYRVRGWDGLRDVTIRMDDFCRAWDQETLTFALARTGYEERARQQIGRDNYTDPGPDDSLRLRDVHFDIRFEWKYIHGGEELDPVPCKPFKAVPCTPWMLDAIHNPCRKQVQELRSLHQGSF